MSGGSTGGIGSDGPVPVHSSPVTSDDPVNPSKGEHGRREVSPTTGQRITPRPQEHESPGKSIHDRKTALEKLPSSEELRMPEEHELSDEEADKFIKQIQARKKQEGSVDKPVESKTKPTSLGASPLTGEKKVPTPLSPDSRTPTNSPVEVDPQTGQSADKPVVSVTGAPKPTDNPKPSPDEKPLPEIPEKKSFLQKHGKELAVTLSGAGIVGVGAILSVFFPPAGLLVYSCGVMMLSMGLSKMLFALEDTPENVPQPKPGDPKPEPEKKEEPPKTSDVDKGKFTAVKKNVLDALKDAGIAPPVDENGNIDQAKVREELEKQRAIQKEHREKILQHPKGAELLKKIEGAVEDGTPANQIIKQAVAAACEGDESIDTEELMDALNPVLNVAENAELLNSDLADEEKEVKVRAALAEFEKKLPTMRDELLDRLYQSTQSASQVPAANSTKLLINTVADLLRREKQRRALKRGEIPIPPPLPASPVPSSSTIPAPPAGPVIKPAARVPSGESVAPQTTVSTAASPVAAIGGDSSDQLIESSKVQLRVFSFELDKVFPNIAGKHGLNDGHKNQLIEIAKEIETEFDAKREVSADLKLSKKMFMEQLQEKTKSNKELQIIVTAIEQQRSGFNQFKS